jgi:hypothetical protein
MGKWDAAIKVGAKAGPIIKKAAPAFKKTVPLVKKGVKAAAPAAKKAMPFVKECKPIVAAPIAVAATKVKQVVLKVDESGERIFKYDLTKLTELFRKHEISADMFNYLSNEFNEHKDILREGGKVFENYFKELSKVKDITQGESLIAEYELARNKWIEANGKKKDSEDNNDANG